jgi:2-polyprenyl-3-methyl-5-hydroxy-6-metoxy-1,4-benzoquinol methylase
MLDAGCGNGWFTIRFSKAGYRPEAVDFSPAAAELTREAVGPGVKVEVAPLDGYQAGRTFPLVVCIDVLFHVTDDERWRATVDNLAAHVGDGGRLLIQDHLTDVPSGPVDPTTSHTRWRTLDAYLQALDGWELAVHDNYVLPGEGRAKDLMVFERTTR